MKLKKLEKLSLDAKQIENRILFYPVLIAVVVSSLLIIITYNFIENYKDNEKAKLELTLLERQKEFTKNELNRVIDEINYLQTQTNIKLKSSLVRKIEEAEFIIKNIIANNPKKSKKELKQIAKNALAPIRFFNYRGYYLVYDKDSKRSVIHPVKSFVNKDMSNFKDKKGQVIVDLFEEAIKYDKEGYVNTYFVKPNSSNKEFKKIIYVKYIPSLNWVIGTGDYIKDVEEELKQEILRSIERKRYGMYGYFWIHNSNHTLLSHPFRQKSIGKDDTLLKDSNNTNIIQEFVKKAKANPQGSFVEYMWQKPDETTQSRKISYVKYLPEWDWVIGTGVYIDNISEEIRKKTKQLDKNIKELYKKLFIVLFFVYILAVLLALKLSERIKKQFNTYTFALNDFAKTLQKQKQEFETIFENSSDSIILTDFDLNIIKFNKAFIELTNFSKEDLKDKNINDLIAKESKRFKKDELLNINNIEKRVVTKNKEYKILNISIGLMSDKKMLIITCKDVTKKKLMESQEKLASMGEMIGNIAHQWRQPLSIISTNASGIKMKNEFNLLCNEDINSSMDSIVKQTQFLSQTIDDFRSFIKSDDNSKINTSILNVIKKSFELTKSSLANNYIEVIYDLDEDCEILAYENQLIQGLINIINNAKDALVENVKKDENKFIFVSTKKSKNKYTITIKDTANGIPKDVIDKIFEPYFTTKHKDVGTGIGLSLTNTIFTKHHKAIIDVFNAQTTYKGNKYFGACFKIEFIY